ncbi:FCD domain-containing protein [Microvirga arvi]|uniref:FCD domain-containing protein n=1 Tax=Microvirga arvi TaxID=2778731 RepID=UPI002105AFCF|nr:FCD domain-containing protein [Microvirga arvi]
MDDTILDPALGLRIRRTESLTSLIRRELERMIEVGELKAGDRLNENALAAKLGVSRGPIREACRGLEQSGLVHVIVNRGVFVREISNHEAAELYDIRAALYALAGRLLAPKITKKQVAELRRMVSQMEDAADKGELNVFYPLNVRFHEAIVQFSGNGRLLSISTSVHREMHLFRRRTLDMPGRMKISNSEHRAIVDALAAKDGNATAQLMEDHVLKSRELLFGPMGTPVD